jgi:hypothetical protein
MSPAWHAAPSHPYGAGPCAPPLAADLRGPAVSVRRYYYAFYNRSILWWTTGLYVFAVLYFFLYARHRVQEHAPEEVAARVAQELTTRTRQTATATDTATRRTVKATSLPQDIEEAEEGTPT